MEEQHKEVLRNLVHGVYDHARAPARPGPRPSPRRAAGAAPPPRRPPPPPVEETPARPADTLFGEDLISEKSLDEVILSYLAGDGRPQAVTAAGAR